MPQQKPPKLDMKSRNALKQFDNRWDRISMFLCIPSIVNLIDCVIFVTMGSPLPMLNTLVAILSEISSH